MLVNSRDLPQGDFNLYLKNENLNAFKSNDSIFVNLAPVPGASSF